MRSGGGPCGEMKGAQWERARGVDKVLGKWELGCVQFFFNVPYDRSDRRQEATHGEWGVGEKFGLGKLGRQVLGGVGSGVEVCWENELGCGHATGVVRAKRRDEAQSGWRGRRDVGKGTLRANGPRESVVGRREELGKRQGTGEIFLRG